MKKIFTGLALLLLFLGGCKKNEMVSLDLKGTLKGEINTLDEFGYEIDDKENVNVKLEGSDPIISSNTDSSGRFVLENIPPGTYNLIISKEGYGEYQEQGFGILGGSEPLYSNTAIFKQSSTTVENISLEIIENSNILLTGTVNHNYDYDEAYFADDFPVIQYFIYNAEDVSSNNFSQSGSILFEKESGSQLHSPIDLNENHFPSGSKIFIITYGINNYDYGYYDILSNQIIHTSLGKGSNTASIVVP